MNYLILFILGIGLGVALVGSIDVTSDKPIKPIVKIKCIDNQCDTTYTYVKD